MARSLRSVLVIAAMLAAVSVTGAAPAAAESQAHRDPRHDVVDLGKAPTPAGIDVVRLENSFHGLTIKMSMTATKLLRQGYEAQWVLQTHYELYRLTYDHRKARPVVTLEQDGERRPRICSGTKAVAKGNTVVAVVSRGCLGGINNVRIAGYLLRARSSGGDKIDDSRQDGYDSGELVFGRLLERN